MGDPKSSTQNDEPEQRQLKPFVLSESEQQRSFIKSINELKPEVQHDWLMKTYSKFGTIRKIPIETSYACSALVEFEDPFTRDRVVTGTVPGEHMLCQANH